MPEIKPREKITDRGTINYGLLNLSVNVSLNKEMPFPYTVFTRVISGVGVQIPVISNRTATGFNAAVGVGIAAVVEWIAIED